MAGQDHAATRDAASRVVVAWRRIGSDGAVANLMPPTPHTVAPSTSGV